RLCIADYARFGDPPTDGFLNMPPWKGRLKVGIEHAMGEKEIRDAPPAQPAPDAYTGVPPEPMHNDRIQMISPLRDPTRQRPVIKVAGGCRPYVVHSASPL